MFDALRWFIVFKFKDDFKRNKEVSFDKKKDSTSKINKVCDKTRKLFCMKAPVMQYCYNFFIQFYVSFKISRLFQDLTCALSIVTCSQYNKDMKNKIK